MSYCAPIATDTMGIESEGMATSARNAEEYELGPKNNTAKGATNGSVEATSTNFNGTRSPPVNVTNVSRPASYAGSDRANARRPLTRT